MSDELRTLIEKWRKLAANTDSVARYARTAYAECARALEEALATCALPGNAPASEGEQNSRDLIRAHDLLSSEEWLAGSFADEKGLLAAFAAQVRAEATAERGKPKELASSETLGLCESKTYHRIPRVGRDGRVNWCPVAEATARKAKQTLK